MTLERYTGEVKGMLKLLADVAADGQADAARMERFLLRDFAAFQNPLQVFCT